LKIITSKNHKKAEGGNLYSLDSLFMQKFNNFLNYRWTVPLDISIIKQIHQYTERYKSRIKDSNDIISYLRSYYYKNNLSDNDQISVEFHNVLSDLID